MKKSLIQLALFCIALTAFTDSFSQSIKKNPNYFKSPSKVGLLIVVDKIKYYGSTSYGSGLIGGAVSGALASSTKKRSKYDSALSIIEPQVEPSLKLKNLYSELYTSKGKQVILIDEPLSNEQLVNFYAPNAGEKKFYAKDLRFLHEKYQIDELLVIEFRYGFRSHYSYGTIEQNRGGTAAVISLIIDLKDNAIIISESSGAHEWLEGAWNTPPAYDNLRNTIIKAIDKALEKDKKKYK